ncbi:MAG TPA: carboxypeptidase regulatory-like domain-containing protein [Blastocatellia bacterium]|nr:carboxypeptidase regulatory-like domain-containing protein [Blastocatellia bacterium]
MIPTVDVNDFPRTTQQSAYAWNGFTITLLLMLLAVALSTEGVAQKRSDRSKNDKPGKTETVGPKRTDRTVTESERVKVITKTEFIRVAVNPNKGYLSLVAVPKATVTLTPLLASPKKASPITEIIKDEDGSLNLINLLPGKYKLSIEHDDYAPFLETIQVDPARPATFVAVNKMISKYGVIRIGGLLPGSKVVLDEVPLKPTDLTQENQSATIAKIPVGKHRLKIAKDGYADFAKDVDVLPGQQAFVSARLDPAQITVSLISQPGARVYAGIVEKAIIPSDGRVAISLPPGKHSLRISKEGYQEWVKDLTLSMANSSVSERVELLPIPSSAEGDWQPTLGARKWFPQTSGWKFETTGALIRGDKPVLFDTESSRDFNMYRDFRLEFDAVFSNGKGMAWVVRAKDINNYYLFEISNPASPSLNLYICKDGKLEWKDSQRIVEKLDKKGDSFHITFDAKGGRFDIGITIASAPSVKPLMIGIFQDDSFSYGGVGFRGKDLSESLLQSFFVIPLR